jgi:hypothetical protein
VRGGGRKEVIFYGCDVSPLFGLFSRLLLSTRRFEGQICWREGG